MKRIIVPAQETAISTADRFKYHCSSDGKLPERLDSSVSALKWILLYIRAGLD